MPRSGHDAVHLVTGFPAFTARRLLRRALETNPGAFFYLIVQPKFVGTVDEELRLAGPGARSRVEVVEGDAAAMDFGLSGKEFLALAEEVEVVHHLASIYYLGV